MQKPSQVRNITRISGGANADRPGLKGQPVTKCVQAAHTDRRTLRDLAKIGLIWPGKVILDGNQPSKLITVPKSWKTRRVIVEEPIFQAWAQGCVSQSLARAVRTLWGPSVDPLSPVWNRSHVADLDYATIDLSSASDSISIEVALAVLPPEWRRVVMRCRSPEVRLPDKSVVTLKKVSGMGNALTFPLEEHVFASIVNYARIRGGHPWQPFGIFGDDILVPNEWYEDVIAALRVFGFTPNEKKSWHQPYRFRESCGYDYFDSTYVTPLRLSRRFDLCCNAVIKLLCDGDPLSHSEKASLQGLVSFTNELFLDCRSEHTHRYMCDVLRRAGALFSCELITRQDETKGWEIIYPALYSLTGRLGVTSSFKLPRSSIRPEFDNEDSLLQWALASQVDPNLGYTRYPWVFNGRSARARHVRGGKSVSPSDLSCEG